MNEILASQKQVDESTKWLEERGLVTRKDCHPKNWDLSQVIPFLIDGDILEMGCYSSVLMDNVEILKFKGERHGVDLRKSYPGFNGAYLSGDMLKLHYENGKFNTIVSLSVIEHGVDLVKFFLVVNQLLNLYGQLILTFDYAEPKIKNHGTDTQPFSKDDVLQMIEIAKQNYLHTAKMNFNSYEPVIVWGNHSPHKDMRYTFGSLRFILQ